ncbi:MAG TPA: cytochrome c oxidase subunit II [Caulobacterales bacterium]|nr:cytochrome c oxidase subunit II [Caulobacterales bacterium]
MKAIAGAALASSAFCAPSWAQEAPQSAPTGATPGGVGLQPAASPVMREIHQFNDFLLPILALIAGFVLLLLIYVMLRYNRAANPTPRKFTHNLWVEILWTIVPVLILVFIAARSFPLLFDEERVPADAQLTLKVTGNMWRWDYEYPDLGVQLTANPLAQSDAEAQGRPYLLATDNPLYVPTHTKVRVLITSNDVIHSWAVPAFGVKDDATQGRVNDTWFEVDREGTYYGQCSELCGQNHAFMPIEVRAVSPEAFNAWVTQQGGHPTDAAPASTTTTATTTTPAPGAPAGSPPTR